MPTDREETGTRISVLLPSNTHKELLALRHYMERVNDKSFTISQVIRQLIADQARVKRLSV